MLKWFYWNQLETNLGPIRHTVNMLPEQRNELTSKGNSGDAQSSYVLFGYYEFTKQDHKSALYWLKKAAEQWNVDAQYNLGNMYTYIDGMTDKSMAQYWLKKAAEQNDTRAVKRLKEIESQK